MYFQAGLAQLRQDDDQCPRLEVCRHANLRQPGDAGIAQSGVSQDGAVIGIEGAIRHQTGAVSPRPGIWAARRDIAQAGMLAEIVNPLGGAVLTQIGRRCDERGAHVGQFVRRQWCAL